VAHEGGNDPYELRRKFSPIPTHQKKNHRAIGGGGGGGAGVVGGGGGGESCCLLQLVAEKAGWKPKPLRQDVGAASATHFSIRQFTSLKSFALLWRKDGNRARPSRVCATMAQFVNPDIVKAQMEGGISRPDGRPSKQKLPENGRVQQEFHDTRCSHVRISGNRGVHIVPSELSPTGLVKQRAPVCSRHSPTPVGPQFTRNDWDLDFREIRHAEESGSRGKFFCWTRPVLNGNFF